MLSGGKCYESGGLEGGTDLPRRFFSIAAYMPRVTSIHQVSLRWSPGVFSIAAYMPRVASSRQVSLRWSPGVFSIAAYMPRVASGRQVSLGWSWLGAWRQ
eukprot:1912201-Pyramimonas_sp.AAC.1